MVQATQTQHRFTNTYVSSYMQIIGMPLLLYTIINNQCETLILMTDVFACATEANVASRFKYLATTSSIRKHLPSHSLTRRKCSEKNLIEGNRIFLRTRVSSWKFAITSPHSGSAAFTSNPGSSRLAGRISVGNGRGIEDHEKSRGGFYQSKTGLDFNRSAFFPSLSTVLFFHRFSSWPLEKNRHSSFCFSRVPDCRLRSTCPTCTGFLFVGCTRDTRLDIGGRKWDCIRKYRKRKRKRERSIE